MPPNDLLAAFDLAISGRHLLDHPYYRSWQEGLLNREDLGNYAEQYRHFEGCLPDVLAGTADLLAEGAARQLVEDNLRDERSRPRPHADIFEGFAEAVGARAQAQPTQATVHLVDLYRRSAAAGPVASLSVVGAYELQAAEVARTKAKSLRENYGMPAAATEFWDVHADLEQAHAAWTIDALHALASDPSEVLTFAKKSAEAWWSFLDERESFC